MRKRILFMGAGIAIFLGVYLSHITSPAKFPNFQEVRAAHQQSEAFLLDRHHEVIHKLRIDKTGRRLDWVALKDISPALQSAVVFAEDRRFYTHKGVDWTAFGSALTGSLTSSTRRGASTITMQLVSLLSEDLRPHSSRRSLWQKFKQIRAAWALERNWSKAEILEAYLNLVTFRGELQGIAAASSVLFSKEAHGLDHSESSILAALLRAPNASIKMVASRASTLSDALDLHLFHGDIAAQTARALSGAQFVKPEADLAPHLASRLLERSGKTQIVSTLDGRLQRFALDTLRHHLLSVKSQNVHDGAALVVDNKAGEVVAYVGNVPGVTSARYVDGIQARRQAGSTLKPFLYGVAFDERLATAASLLDDSPTDLPVLGGIYRPQNYDNQFHGLVTARIALASSLNVPAVKMLNLVGVGLFLEKLREAGFQSLRSADYYGPSLALGSADVALWDLVNAYRCLANGGVWSELRLTFDKDRGVPDRRALSKGAAFIVSDILSDRESRSRTFSLESPLATRFWTAVKTGTSKDMRDNWCIGYSNRFTVGVWVGNFSGEPMWNISGVAGAAPVWVEIMNYLHKDEPNRPPVAPAGLVATDIEIPSSDQRRRELFLKGTEMRVVQQQASQANFRITQPASATVVALDPDIPSEQQRILFESDPRDSQMRWILNGEDIGPAGSVLLWNPIKGNHTLSLVDTAHRVVDSIKFEVRGNPSQ